MYGAVSIESEPFALPPLPQTAPPSWALKLGVIALSFACTIPFISPSVELSQGHLAAKITLILGNVLAYGPIGAWAYLKMIGEVKKEKNATASLSITVIKTVLSVVGGLMNQAPSACMAYKYNQNNITDALLLLIASPIPIYSLWLLFGNLHRFASHTPVERKIEATRVPMIKRLLHNAHLEYESESGKVHFENDHPPEQCGGAYAEWTGRVLSGFSVFFSGYVGYSILKQVTPDSPIQSSLFGLFISLCSSYLVFQRVRGAVHDTFDHALNKRTISNCLLPTATPILRIISIILAVLSNGPTIQMCRDVFPAGIEKVMEVAVSLASTLLVANVLGEVTDDLVIDYASRCGTPKQKKMVEYHEKVLDYAERIRRSKLEDYVRFLNKLAPNITGKHLHQNDLTKDELRNYLQEKIAL